LYKKNFAILCIVHRPQIMVLNGQSRDAADSNPTATAAAEVRLGLPFVLFSMVVIYQLIFLTRLD